MRIDYNKLKTLDKIVEFMHETKKPFAKDEDLDWCLSEFGDCIEEAAMPLRIQIEKMRQVLEIVRDKLDLWHQTSLIEHGEYSYLCDRIDSALPSEEESEDN